MRLSRLRFPPGVRAEIDRYGFIRLVKARSPKDNPDNYLGTDRRGWLHWLRMPLSALRQAQRRSSQSAARPRFLPLLDYDTDLPKRVRRRIHGVERQIATLPHEVAWVFTPAGQVLTPVGVTEQRRTRIRLSHKVAALMAGNILTHNHPGGGTFSVADVKTAIRRDVLEVRVVGIDATGTARTYRLRRPKKGAWPSAWEVALRFTKMSEMILADPVWEGRPRNEVAHECWTRLVRTFFPSLTYVRMP